jgi:Ni,Fe-hydrogenase III small subunit/NAD-dependent dihydropyrimidine dehydrogenase PreA subunit
MLDVLWARLQQKHRTIEYPNGPAPVLPDRFAGRPTISSDRCKADCRLCVEVCPTQALTKNGSDAVSIDLGACLFCGECAAACPNAAIRFTNDYKTSAAARENLIISAASTVASTQRVETPNETARRLFGKSLKLRQVSAGGCNACEADTNVLGTVGWDLGRFGIQFVASPRHADGLLITGPVPKNMRLALLKTYEAVPAPKLVIAVGACAISGGPYKDHIEVHNGAGGLVPIDLHIPGCPPHPLTILDGLLRLIGRI